MILALGTMDATLQGIFFLVAVVLFAVSAVATRSLIAAGLAVATFVFAYNAFAAA